MMHDGQNRRMYEMREMVITLVAGGILAALGGNWG